MLGLENLGPELQTALTAVLGPLMDRITSLEATVAAQAAALETKTAADVATDLAPVVAAINGGVAELAAWRTILQGGFTGMIGGIPFTIAPKGAA